MIRRLSAVAGLLLAGPALAQIPPPQAPLTEESVLAWVREHVETEGWGLLAADAVAASFGSPGGVSVLPDGNRTTEIRREYYGPERLGPDGTRSGRQTWIVDCKARRVWVRRITIYAENNMKGAARTRESASPNWTEVSSGSANDKILGEICAASTTRPPI